MNFPEEATILEPLLEMPGSTTFKNQTKTKWIFSSNCIFFFFAIE